jgi:two-component system response regulator
VFRAALEFQGMSVGRTSFSALSAGMADARGAMAKSPPGNVLIHVAQTTGRTTMKSKTILLVEDNPDDVRLTMHAFGKTNIVNELHVVNDGVEAMDYLLGVAKAGDPKLLPAVILLDLKLPRMDGLEVLKRIRANEQLKRLPVVILTSSREDQDILKSYDLGASSYICKPVDFEQFIEAVHYLGLYWLLLNELPPKTE